MKRTTKTLSGPSHNRPHTRASSGYGSSIRDYSLSSATSSALPSTRQLYRQDQRSSSTNIQQEIRLISNAYSLVTTRDLTVHEYSLQITTTAGCNDNPIRVLTRNYVSRSIMKLVMNDLVPKIIANRSFVDSVVVDSNLETIFSLKPFNMNREGTSAKKLDLSEREFIFKNLSVETDLLSPLHVDIAIRYSQSFGMQDSAERGIALQTSVLHHQLTLNMIRYGSVYYLSHEQSEQETRSLRRLRHQHQENRLDLLSSHIMGISLSGLRRTVDAQTLVVISSSNSYLTKSHRLIDLLASFIAGRPVESIQLNHSSPRKSVHIVPELASVKGDEEWFEGFTSILSGFKCCAGSLQDSVNLRFQLTIEPASKLVVESATKSPITVQEYYRHIGIILNYPNLPCLASKTSYSPYYPLELCSLLPDQKVPIFRLSTAARNHLTVLNKPKPDLYKRSSVKGRNDLVAAAAPQFRSFGISLSEDPVEAVGSTLQKPTLQFKDRACEPERDYWESGCFFQPIHLQESWCVVNTVPIDSHRETEFFSDFDLYCNRFGLQLGRPHFIEKPKQILDDTASMKALIGDCQRKTNGNLRFIMFVIDSSSTPLNRLVHLSFDEHADITATCIRAESILNHRQKRSIFRTLAHKLNARLGGTNVTYNDRTLKSLNLTSGDLMIIGLDVTHPDNELNGVSIVGCAYTYSKDLFKHRSLVWPQTARAEIIGKMDDLMKRLIQEYHVENNNRLPKQVIIYRDGVSHEEFKKVRNVEVVKVQLVLIEAARELDQTQPNLSYVIAQKRHTMRFFRELSNNTITNPPSGTLIDKDVVCRDTDEFYLYSNTSPQATARPLHYHVLSNGLGIENLQKLTYFLCFNFGKCSGTLSMPSSLKYAHNAAYDARNRVIAAREFSENRFYPSKFFC